MTPLTLYTLAIAAIVVAASGGWELRRWWDVRESARFIRAAMRDAAQRRERIAVARTEREALYFILGAKSDEDAWDMLIASSVADSRDRRAGDRT